MSETLYIMKFSTGGTNTEINMGKCFTLMCLKPRLGLASGRSFRLERVEDRGLYQLNRLDVLIRLHLFTCSNMHVNYEKSTVKVGNSGKMQF